MQTGPTCTILILKLGWKRPIFNCLSIDCLMYTLHVHKLLFLKVKLEIPRDLHYVSAEKMCLYIEQTFYGIEISKTKFVKNY